MIKNYGEVKSVRIPKKIDGTHRGFAFVEFTTDAEANEAIKKFNNFELDGRKIVVNEARPQEDRANRSSFGNNFNRSRSW